MKRELLTPVIVVTGIVGVVTGIVTGKKVSKQLRKRKLLKNAIIINPDCELRKFTDKYVADIAGETTLYSKEIYNIKELIYKLSNHKEWLVKNDLLEKSLLCKLNSMKEGEDTQILVFFNSSSVDAKGKYASSVLNLVENEIEYFQTVEKETTDTGVSVSFLAQTTQPVVNEKKESFICKDNIFIMVRSKNDSAHKLASDLFDAM